jgi:glycosyltransferase involved in cell wall biosynthesis
MPQISVVIITFNEEKDIERCILSVKDIADEIVVLDSFSTDKTEEICKKHNVNFFQHKFDGYIEQKNRAITLAKFPHILSLDADEALSDELKKSILGIKNNWNFDGYYFNRITNFCGKWIKNGGWYPDQKLRLVDSRKGCWKGNNPHDKYTLEKGSKSQHLKGDLLHYSYYSVEQYTNQLKKFAIIGADSYLKKQTKCVYFKFIVNPTFKFLKMYFLKFGFLDGNYGFIIAYNAAKYTHLKYSTLIQLKKQQNAS